MLQHQAARLGDGPRSGREPDVRAPGYLPEVWKVVPGSDLDAGFSQRLVRAKLVEVLNVPANEQLRFPLPRQIQDVILRLFQALGSFAVPAQRLELLDKPGRRVFDLLSSRTLYARRPHRVG